LAEKKSSSVGVASGALAGLRVVELTDLRGALAGRMLADLGADVLKVEPPAGDPGRLRPPFAGNLPDADRSLPFLYRNAGKRGVRIELGDASGLESLHELCAQADVLLENLGPQAQRRHGLTPTRLRARHPHLIHASISDFGLSGPHASWRLEPLAAFAASGALHASGFPELPPCWLPGYLAHDCASVYAVVGVLVALLERARSGAGQSIEVSVQEAAINGLNPWSISLGDYARVYPLLPSSPPRDADGPYMVLPARDGFVRVLPATPRQLAGFVKLLWGHEVPHSTAHAGSAVERDVSPDDLLSRLSSLPLASLITDLPREALHLTSAALLAASRLLPLPGATISAVHAITAIGRQLAGNALGSRTRSEVLAAAGRLHVPIAPVNTLAEFVAAEQTRVRGYFRHTRFRHLKDAPFAQAPWRFSATKTCLARPAPAPGEDDRRGFGAQSGNAEARGRGQAAAAPSEARSAPVLDGLRVVNLGVAAVVPELCWLLSELGAEVIKIESRANPDVLRRLTIEPEALNRSWMFNDSSRGQKSVCLDLRTPRGRELALRLCGTADVVAENCRGDVVRSLGLDYDDVRRLRPDVIYLSSQGYGRDGPLGDVPSFGPLNSAFAGATWLWNHPGAAYPAGSSLNHPDHIASKLAAIAVLAALEHRRRTGDGQRIEMAQTEATAYLMGELYLEGAATGREVRPAGNAVEYACPHGVYPCAGVDRWCAIAVVGDEAWQLLRFRLGWPDERRLAALEGRLAARAELDTRLAGWTRSRSAEEVAAELQAAGVSAMMVQNGDDHRGDPHLARRGALVPLEHPELGRARYSANPLRMSRTRMARPRPAPLLGEHTEEVLTRLLALSRQEVRDLVATGVCR